MLIFIWAIFWILNSEAYKEMVASHGWLFYICSDSRTNPGICLMTPILSVYTQSMKACPRQD